MQAFIHYFLHFGFPFVIAYTFFRKEWKKVYLILLTTMLMDLDHLLAHPIFQANRCSIGFHPLHSFYAFLFYIVLLFFKKPYRIIAIGLLFHLFTDLVVCMMLFNDCKNCLAAAPAFQLLKSIGVFLGM